LKPSIIKYWKNGKWITSKQVFYDEDALRQWYKMMRNRIDGLTIVIPLDELKQREEDDRLLRAELEATKDKHVPDYDATWYKFGGER
jgi:hypothetical protein